MDSSNKDTSDDTVRLRRPPARVFTDECGNNVWMGDVEVVDLELVQIDDSSDDPYNNAKIVDTKSGLGPFK